MVKVCPVCGTANAEDAEICKGCNIRLGLTSQPSMSDTEIDALVHSILVKKEAKKEEKVVTQKKPEIPVPLKPPQQPPIQALKEEQKVPKIESESAEIGQAKQGKPPHPSQISPVPQIIQPQTQPPRIPHLSTQEIQTPHISFFTRYFPEILVLLSLSILFAIFGAFQLWRLSDIFWIGFTLLLITGVVLSSIIYLILSKSSAEIALGDRLLSKGRYNEAIQHYDRAIKYRLCLSAAWTNKGVAYKKMGRYSEALACFNQAIEIDSRNEIAWTNRGDIFFKLGNYAEAIKCYQEAISINPRYEVAWNNLGVANERIGAFKEAERCYDTAIKLKPGYRMAYLNKGDLLARTGREVEAAQYYRNAGVV